MVLDLETVSGVNHSSHLIDADKNLRISVDGGYALDVAYQISQVIPEDITYHLKEIRR